MRLASQFLHVRVLRSRQRVRMRPAKPWTFQFQQTRLRQDRVLDSRREQIELDLEIVKKRDDPAHNPNIACGLYWAQAMYQRVDGSRDV